MKTVNEKVSALRSSMEAKGISAIIIPGTDPHASEYPADCWKERVWVSGFNGSAGTAAVTTKKAGLWTDSRYFLQAAEQLSGSDFALMKMGLPETPEIIYWLTTELNAGERVAVNPQMFSVKDYAHLKSELALAGIELVSADLIGDLWTDRPATPSDPLFIYDVKYTGRSASEKLTLLRNELAKAYADATILSSLDEIAWLYNIRGNDVKYNPVVIAYSIVENTKATLFIDENKLGTAERKSLNEQGVEIAPYSEIYNAITKINVNKAVLIDAAKLNQSLFEKIPSAIVVRKAVSPVTQLKSIKNEVEMAGIRLAMVKDGVALTKFFIWLEKNLKSGELTELSVDKKLYKCRAEQDGFKSESFSTIAGYAAHGAIVHYSATPESNATLKPESLFLLDSGAQYLDGTTDITRTIALGTPTIQQKSDFTLVLKGHIALAQAQFIQGTRGSQLDILARQAMWNLGINYGHGTGHGVGHFLNVHEGPQNIRMDENPTELKPGMFISNEPGIYRTNQYGIRTENLVFVVEAKETEFGKFFKFETQTLFPIDINLIDTDAMTKSEIEWLNDYHTKVYKRLSPLLNEDERMWLSVKCTPIKWVE
ncbi:MAG: aminopeptidase P family protein [Paludibacter sp.]|jgi:Xaa-Pro aminopeptidase|nr:aminopeptidase P family protein [Paludibacter sp.]